MQCCWQEWISCFKGQQSPGDSFRHKLYLNGVLLSKSGWHYELSAGHRHRPWHSSFFHLSVRVWMWYKLDPQCFPVLCQHLYVSRCIIWMRVCIFTVPRCPEQHCGCMSLRFLCALAHMWLTFSYGAKKEKCSCFAICVQWALLALHCSALAQCKLHLDRRAASKDYFPCWLINQLFVNYVFNGLSIKCQKILSKPRGSQLRSKFVHVRLEPLWWLTNQIITTRPERRVISMYAPMSWNDFLQQL